MEGRPPDDVALAERAARGDERAFEELVRIHQGIAYRTAYLLTGSAADAEDAAQVAFVRAWSLEGPPSTRYDATVNGAPANPISGVLPSSTTRRTWSSRSPAAC